MLPSGASRLVPVLASLTSQVGRVKCPTGNEESEGHQRSEWNTGIVVRVTVERSATIERDDNKVFAARCRHFQRRRPCRGRDLTIDRLGKALHVAALRGQSALEIVVRVVRRWYSVGV